MFAFALWDEARRELSARPRPLRQEAALLRRHSGETLLFGSELKALSQHPRCPRELDLDSLARYLALEYVPTPHSIFEGVAEAAGRPRPPLARRAGRRSSATGTCRSADDDRTSARTSTPSACATTSATAVRRRLISDVPLGAFLSGGIDSSSVVALMVRAPAGAAPSRPSRSASTSRASTSRQHARRVAAALRHRSPRGRLHARRACSTCSRRSPTSSTSRSPTRRSSRPICCRASRASIVTVALGGDGSDELLAGYPTFPADRRRALLPRAARPPRATSSRRSPTAAGLDGATSASTSSSSGSCAALTLPTDERHAAWLGAFTPAEQTHVLVGRRRPTRLRRASARLRRGRADTRRARAPDLPLRRRPICRTTSS